MYRVPSQVLVIDRFQLLPLALSFHDFPLWGCDLGVMTTNTQRDRTLYSSFFHRLLTNKIPRIVSFLRDSMQNFSFHIILYSLQNDKYDLKVLLCCCSVVSWLSFAALWKQWFLKQQMCGGLLIQPTHTEQVSFMYLVVLYKQCSPSAMSTSLLNTYNLVLIVGCANISTYSWCQVSTVNTGSLFHS